MTDEIKPALTPEGWREAGRYSPGEWLVPDSTDWGSSPEDWHRIAALCLRGQPFGFTWEDVAALDEAVTQMASTYDRCVNHEEEEAVKREQQAVESVRERIAALLPHVELRERR